jgi:hypothetical protein
MKRARFTEEQIMSLLVHPGDGEGKIVPQLQETAGWVAVSSSAVFRRITAADPQVLLRGDAARVDEKSRAALLDALLKGTEKEELFVEIEQRSDLHKLSHGGIEDQLRPYIVDRSRKEGVRNLAIDIARACKTGGLQDEVATIALDPSERYELRKHAAFCVGQVADKAIRATLKPLTVGSADDVDDDLKGWALRAMWPDSMTAEELFERLSSPKRENYFGAYKGFLRQLEEVITPDMLPVALKWAESHAHNQSDIGRLIDKLLILGFEYIEKPEVIEPYIKLVLKRLRETYAILSDRTDKDFSRRITEDRAKRRLLIGNLVKTANDPVDASSTMFRINRLIADEDFSWLIDQCTTADSPERSIAFAKLVHFTFNIRNFQHVDAVIAAKNNFALATEFAWLFAPVELNSPQAERMKQWYEQQQELR